MRAIRTIVTFLFATLALTVVAQNTQPNTQKAQDLGWTSSMNFDGSANSQDRVFDVDSSVGYNFDQHWGAGIGVPLSFVSSSSSTTTSSAGTKSTSPSSSLNSLGNVHMDVDFKTKGDVAAYASTLTVAAPTGSTANGVNTGRPNIGWNNHVEHSFSRLTPFVEASFSNGLTDTHFYHRPYTTLGFVSQFTGGTTVDLGRNFSVGASLYDVLPSGQQKMFSKLVGRKSAFPAGAGTHGRAYELAAETTGSASLTRDNGESAWVEFSPGHIFDFQVGYTHSVHLALDTVSFNMGVDVGRLVKGTARQ